VSRSCARATPRPSGNLADGCGSFGSFPSPRPTGLSRSAIVAPISGRCSGSGVSGACTLVSAVRVSCGQSGKNPLSPIHLDSGPDVVIVEALLTTPAPNAPGLRQVHEKHHWQCQVWQFVRGSPRCNLGMCWPVGAWAWPVATACRVLAVGSSRMWVKPSCVMVPTLPAGCPPVSISASPRSNERISVRQRV